MKWLPGKTYRLQYEYSVNSNSILVAESEELFWRILLYRLSVANVLSTTFTYMRGAEHSIHLPVRCRSEQHHLHDKRIVNEHLSDSVDTKY